jgi:heme-degrading monooxygenase HmoA
MFAVAGRWILDPAQAEQQSEALQRIVAGVQELPGFVRGFWSHDVAAPSVNVTFIVFETLDQAEGFRKAVEANAPAQEQVGVARNELRVVEVVAHA